MFTTIVLMLFFNYRTVEELQFIEFRKIGYVLINATITVLLFYFILSWFNKRITWKNHWYSRLFLDIAVVIFHTFIFILIANTSVAQQIMVNQFPRFPRELLYVMPLTMNALILVTLEMFLAMEERNILELQLAQMEKEQINAKYGALKEQIDHHFLFNNLSVLSSLIYEDVERADRFIQDFASTYRYVLHINQRNLVSVKEELDFIDTYLNLYKCRFEDGFDYTLNVDKSYCNRMIPPLTLQVLVENAIKHNIVSRQQPLNLRIYCNEKSLVVRNTLQLKSDRIISTQTGQINLVEKYRLLGTELPVFKAEKGEYVVTIPLIEPNEDKSINC
jgi:sensor histidine kinase YesM